MLQETVIYPPNRPYEKEVEAPKVPEAVNYLFFVDINKKGQGILSSSDVTGTGWFGTVFSFENTDDLVKFKFNDYHVSTSTISDGKFFKDDQILIAEDNRCLALLNLNGELSVQEAFENEDIIEQVSVWNDHGKIAVCFDRSLSILSVQNQCGITSENTYRNYHTEVVTSVDVDPSQPNIFASASMDRKACIWDDRMETPANILYENEFASLRSIAINPTNSNLLGVGTTAGSVYLLDKRQPNEFLSVSDCFKHGIHRLKFGESGNLAVCADDRVVRVLGTNDASLSVLYSSEGHSGIVRGLSWYNSDLYSCGFDRKIVKHVL